MKAAIYIRISTGKQESDNQLNQLVPWCQKAGYEVFNTYVDVITGGEDSRPEYDRMFSDAHQHKFDLVLFWALDRFSRSGTLFTLQKLKELDNLGIGWESYTEPYFQSIGQFKDVVISIMATLAKIEKQRISERTKAGLVGKEKAHKDKFGNLKQGTGKRGKDKQKRNRAGYFKKRSPSQKVKEFINKYK